MGGEKVNIVQGVIEKVLIAIHGARSAICSHNFVNFDTRKHKAGQELFTCRAVTEAPTVPDAFQVSVPPGTNGKAPLTFQEAITRLQQYWASVGCALWQPHNSEVQYVASSLSNEMHSCLPDFAALCFSAPL